MKCIICDEAIEDGKIISADGRFFDKKCFKDFCSKLKKKGCKK